ncbi:capsid protein [Thermodesulfobacteriota bacterium]
MPDAEYHTPGEEILGQNVPHSEKVITIDKLLISHIFMPDIDEAMTHFEVRSKYSGMMGQKLSQTFDLHVMCEMLLNARASATITDSGDDGFIVADADLASATEATRLSSWVDALYDTAVNFDNKFVTGPRYCVVKPDDYRFLAKAVKDNGFSVLHRDYGVTQGSFSQGEIPPIAGINIISSPMLPSTDLSGATFHAVNANTTKGMVFTPDAVGTVKLMDLSLQTQWDIRRQGTLMVGRYAMGHGGLQPECSAELRTGTPS